MKRYERLNEIDSGSNGVVYRALDKKTNEVVAVKKMMVRKYTSLEDCANSTEVKTLGQMNHPNIVKLKEFFKENGMLFLVSEFMESSLRTRMSSKKARFSETEIRNLCFQVFQGLAHMHSKGYFHRDLRPDNLLVSKDVIKISDLGVASETNRKVPYSYNVGSRWYRAPEVFLRAWVHDPAVDMWAMGAIMAELYTNQPLFQGESDGEVLNNICSVIGSPTESNWSEGLVLAGKMNYEFPDLAGVPLATVLPASKKAVSLIASLLSWDPSKRPTAVEALDHPFFQPNRVDPPQPKKVLLKKQETISKSSTAKVEPKAKKFEPKAKEKVEPNQLTRMLQEKFVSFEFRSFGVERSMRRRLEADQKDLKGKDQKDLKGKDKKDLKGKQP